MTKRILHLHNYKRINIASFGKEPYLVFKCLKPLCSHYIRIDLAEGKMCECSICHEMMIINKESINHAKPHCSGCIKRKKVKDVNINELTDFLNKIVP